MVDPAAVTPSLQRPAIVVESVVVDNEPVDPGATPRLTAPSRLQFGYTSLSLRNPENIRFRYKLEGYDKDWEEADTSRQVTYGTLRPGSYRFHVIGSGSEGVWNEEGAAFAFHIVPVFYNTWWFRTLAIAFVGAAFGGMYRLRVRRLTQQMHIRFEERLAERTRIARDLHDTLLQTVQGSKLVAENALRNAADHTRAVRALEQLSTWLTQATEEGRAAVNSLRTSAIEQNDLADALRRAVDKCRSNSRAEIAMSVSGDSRPVPPAVRDEVYWIAFEALRNATAHAGGDRIDVSLVYDDDLTVRVSDNGDGIEPHILETGREGHFGLPGMKERAERINGTLTVVGSSGSGTEVTLVVPGPDAFLPGRYPP